MNPTPPRSYQVYRRVFAIVPGAFVLLLVASWIIGYFH